MTQVVIMKYYKGTFNWYGEIHTLHTRKPALSEGMAYRQFTRVLALKLQRTCSVVKLYFNGEKDNYKIEEVKHDEK
uniref:Uncharacterized protein n=1 Tax=viral metagenome TaxID=1070528 RepID=A0A6M3JCQ4_9ZZZZ